MELIKSLLSSGTPAYLVLYLVIINIIGLVIMSVDKYLAIAQKWRISEKTLLTVAVIGGSLGVFAGMYIFRHKTKHLLFTITIPIMIIAHATVLYIIFLK